MKCIKELYCIVVKRRTAANTKRKALTCFHKEGAFLLKHIVNAGIKTINCLLWGSDGLNNSCWHIADGPLCWC